MLDRVRFYRDEALSCGHVAHRFDRSRVLHGRHCAQSIKTPIICPVCGGHVRARFVRAD